LKRILILAFVSVLVACAIPYDTKKTEVVVYDTLQVTSTAYNSVAGQTTTENPALAAWGDTLEPGMRAIAISRDLIDSGLVHNTAVYIEGFDEPFLVKDKMNKRWRNKVDIYMGLDIDSARSWGKQQIKIYIPVDTVVVEK
jgi:3D (Asp-Asp-Asp) domain-containing protein